MIPTRIRHLGVCEHPQTPYQRRKCRAALVARITREQEAAMQEPRYTVTSMRTRRGMLHYVYDSQTGQEVCRSTEEHMATGRADTLNRRAAEAAAPAESTPTPPATGWSKAARRRAGRSGGGHPLGTVVERGAGYTVYADGLRGEGTVQIWDES